MKVTGFSHVTLNVSNLDRSLEFYANVLGLKVKHRGNKDAYLEWGDAWICIQEVESVEILQDNGRTTCGIDHIAFHVNEAHFQEAVRMIEHNHIPVVRGPLRRGIGWSINFLDPDGSELELHTSNLEERLKVWR